MLIYKYNQFGHKVMMFQRKGKRDPSTVQTLIFDRMKFKTPKDARNWAKENEFKSGKVDEKEKTFRLRQMDPNKFKPGTFRTIELASGVKAIIGRLK